MDDLQPAQVLTDDEPELTPAAKAASETAIQPSIADPQALQEATVASVPQVSDNRQALPPAANYQADQQYDQEIKSAKIETKRKTFFMDLKANSMGRYIKISERSSGKRSTIIIPEENINEFIEKISALLL